MKFHWFAEVTYPHLPSDFAETYPSAWVTPPPRLLDPLKAGQTYRMFLDLMEYADEVGFDGLAVNEHHQTAGAMTPSPNLLAASLAKNTKNAAILVIGDSLALYNPPTRVAEEMAYLDCLSEGRLIAGFVYGTAMDSMYAYGIPPSELRPRFAEARELILRSWQAEEPFAFNGKYTKLRYVNPWPRPVQQPLPPIWVPGSGSIETWDLVTDLDYCYGHLSFSGMRSAKPVVDEYWNHVSRRNGNMNPHRMAFTQIVCVSETDAQAERDYYDAVRYFYRYTNRVSRGFVSAPGYRSAQSMTWELERQQSNPDREKAYKGELSFGEYDEKGFIIAGSPATVRQRMRELVTELRVGQIIATPHIGDLSEETGRKNTYLFAKEVIPYLRDIWADEPDHWTPAVSQERVAAAEREAAAVPGN
jgi:alkanesulfonate monooxygenase SsuD/methylene tetrahydromethanopterin reductase-like flavin-dependent oxidoreductase (luciferase family)